nr:hypothetical protein [Burkholderia sp. BCC1630]
MLAPRVGISLTGRRPAPAETSPMLKLVRLALARPYTFIVLALLILIAGPLAALRTPTDILPDIRARSVRQRSRSRSPHRLRPSVLACLSSQWMSRRVHPMRARLS